MRKSFIAPDPILPHRLTAQCLRGAFLKPNSWMKFLSIILRVIRLEVSVYNVYITKQFQTTFARGGGGGGVVNPLEEVTVNSKEENSYCPSYVQEFGLWSLTLQIYKIEVETRCRLVNTNHRERKSPKHSFLLKFAPGCVQRHSLKFITPPPLVYP
jgi:hypothetical protein